MTIPRTSDFWRSSLDPDRVMNVNVTHWQENEQQRREDHLTVEEPFEIRIASRSLAVIMRTPGHDSELAMGFLFTEGVIHGSDDVLAIEDATDADGLPLANVVNVLLRSAGQGEEGHDGQTQAGQAQGPCTLSPRQRSTSAQPPPVPTFRRPPPLRERGQREEGHEETSIHSQFERHFAVSASCGLCGKNSIDDVMISTPPLESDDLRISAACIYDLPGQLRTSQAVFTHTGGLHAAALFTSKGELLLLREDVGRHNAVDKIIGHGLLHGNFPYSRHILMVSGRTSFEIIQKALLARIPCIAAISAPSSLAVELADSAGITLIGFLRDRSMNVYTHAERIV